MPMATIDSWSNQSADFLYDEWLSYRELVADYTGIWKQQNWQAVAN
jgi:hypothetical protein